MSAVQNFRKRVANLIFPTAKNAMNLARDYLRYGNKKMSPDWTQVVMEDRDLYTGYAYAAIRNRANKVARIAGKDIRTTATTEGFVHPYLDTIEQSPSFTDTQFWYDISTYLDLEGVYYLMAIRAVDAVNQRVGNIQEFKLLNPYNIRRVLAKDSLAVSGYVETRNGYIREIPAEMIIEIRELNPFDENTPYAMTDAAKEAQFTLKTAGDFTRNSLKHNINAPGLISTDVILEEKEFINFTDRIKNHTKGEPIFGNGSGTITWESMNVELSKAALKDINEMNREALFAVSGVSKTIMNIEQSGVTRESSKVQKDLSVEDHILPRIQLIIDALNQDYRNHYAEYQSNQAKIIVDNPVATDHDAEMKENEVKKGEFDLYEQLLAAGYDPELAGKYVCGDIDIEMLGEPTNEPTATPATPPAQQNLAIEENTFREDEREGVVTQQEGMLKNAVVNTEEQLVVSAMSRVSRIVKNDIKENELITKRDKKTAVDELVAILTGFYGIMFNFIGKQTMRNRIGQYALIGQFGIDKGSNAYIKSIAKKVAESHVDTVSQDIFNVAREAALKGLSVPQIEALIKEKYNKTIVENRAKVIARTETNRAFTRAQYEADRQFIQQNNLEGRVYKVWHTRSSNPCPFCLSLEAEGEIPFSENFRDLGEEVVVGEGKNRKVLDINFEALKAGNAHPNCSCEYELIIKNVQNSMKTEIDEIKKTTVEVKTLLEQTKAKDDLANLKEQKLQADQAALDQQMKELDKILDKL